MVPVSGAILLAEVPRPHGGKIAPGVRGGPTSAHSQPSTDPTGRQATRRARIAPVS